MNHISANILSLSSEAALLVEKNRISYANPAATALLGSDCVDKFISEIFGAEFIGTQASSFIGDVPIKDQHYIVRVSKLDFGQVIFLSPSSTAPVCINDAFIFAAKDALNNINMAIETGRLQTQTSDNKYLPAVFQSLTRSFYSLNRIISNASIVKNLAEDSLVYSLAQTNLSLFFSNIMETVSALYHNCIFSLNLGENICAPVDTLMTSTLLLNLISNCLVHAEGCDKISITLSESADMVLLSVSNNGTGIPPEKLHCVFDCYKHNFGALQMPKGAGLGLAAAKGIAELHKGTLLIESRPSLGTCVRVSFSKKDNGKVCVHTPKEDYEGQMRHVLMNLANCLPQECFTEKFND